jgi:hypothetical protein
MGRGLSPLQSAILDTLRGLPMTTPDIRDHLLRYGRVSFHTGDDSRGSGTFVLRRALGGLYSRRLVAFHTIPDTRGGLRTGAWTYVWCRNDDAGLAAMRRSFGGLGEPNRRGEPPCPE